MFVSKVSEPLIYASQFPPYHLVDAGQAGGVVVAAVAAAGAVHGHLLVGVAGGRGSARVPPTLNTLRPQHFAALF